MIEKNYEAESSGKSFGYHLFVYFVAVITGVFIFILATYLVKFPTPCANSRTCGSDLSLKIENKAVGVFQGQKVIPPKIDMNLGNINPKISSQSANSSSLPKHIYIDLGSQTLYAYSGNTEFMHTLISSGKWGRTPTGNFNIWTKLFSTRMAGGEGADAYDLPNVPYVMYFYSDFGLHGAYWHDNFGHVMSHGCVNMRQIDAKTLYEWADAPVNGKLGTPVSVCDSFTSPNICVQKNPIN